MSDETPERIWAKPAQERIWVDEEDAPYVRADLYDALQAENARLRAALQMLHHAVCGETGFANAVRLESGKAYPWHPLDDADERARAALEKPTP